MIIVSMSNPAVGEIVRELLLEDPQHPVLLIVDELREGFPQACELAADWARERASRLRELADQLSLHAVA